MKIPNADVGFLISALSCYDVTMKSKKVLGNCRSSADKGCDPKIVLLGYILHKSMKSSFL